MNSYKSIDILRTYVTGQAKLGYTCFEPGPQSTDVMLATFPKSGSTWISYLLYQLSSGGDEAFPDIKDVVIDITPGHWDPGVNPFEIPQTFKPRTYKTHGSWRLAPRGCRTIYVSRNPTDVFWSLYNFIHDLFGLEEMVEIDDFYQQYFVERFGSGHDIGNIWDHLLGWCPQRTREDVLWLHYEDLREDFSACIFRIAEFMGVGTDSDLLQLVEERATIEHTRSLAEKLNPSQDNRTGVVTLKFGHEMESYARGMKFGKIRKGKVGDGNKELPEHILQKLEQEWRQRVTPVLGYKDYGEMRQACSLLNS